MNRRYRRLAIWVSLLLGLPILVLCVFVLQKRPSGPDPHQIKSLTVYWSLPRDLDEDALVALPHIHIDPAITKALFSHVKYSRSPIVLWKGDFAGLATLEDGSRCRVLLSFYGGFFQLFPGGDVYYFAGESRRTWDDLFHQTIVPGFAHPEREKPLEE